MGCFNSLCSCVRRKQTNLNATLHDWNTLRLPLPDTITLLRPCEFNVMCRTSTAILWQQSLVSLCFNTSEKNTIEANKYINNVLYRKCQKQKEPSELNLVQAVHLCVYTPWFAHEFDLSPVGLGLYGLRLWRRWILFPEDWTSKLVVNSGIFPELPPSLCLCFCQLLLLLAVDGSPAVLVVVGGGGWYYCTSTRTTTKIATEARRLPPQSAERFGRPQHDWSTSNCCSQIPLGCTLTSYERVGFMQCHDFQWWPYQMLTWLFVGRYHSCRKQSCINHSTPKILSRDTSCSICAAMRSPGVKPLVTVEPRQPWGGSPGPGPQSHLHWSKPLLWTACPGAVWRNLVGRISGKRTNFIVSTKTSEGFLWSFISTEFHPSSPFDFQQKEGFLTKDGDTLTW